MTDGFVHMYQRMHDALLCEYEDSSSPFEWKWSNEKRHVRSVEEYFFFPTSKGSAIQISEKQGTFCKRV